MINDIHVHLGQFEKINATQLAATLPAFKAFHNIANLALISSDLGIEKNEMAIRSLFGQPGIYGWKMLQAEKDFELDHKRWIGAKHHGTFEKRPISDPVYSKALEELDRIIVHCGRYNNGEASSVTSFKHAIKAAIDNPQVSFVLAHMGGNDTDIVMKAADAAAGVPNVFFDTSGISTPFRVEYAVKRVGADRILFGSDHPWCSFLGQYHTVKDSLISDTDKQKIFTDNFLKLIPSG